MESQAHQGVIASAPEFPGAVEFDASAPMVCCTPRLIVPKLRMAENSACRRSARTAQQVTMQYSSPFPSRLRYLLSTLALQMQPVWEYQTAPTSSSWTWLLAAGSMALLPLVYLYKKLAAQEDSVFDEVLEAEAWAMASTVGAVDAPYVQGQGCTQLQQLVGEQKTVVRSTQFAVNRTPFARSIAFQGVCTSPCGGPLGCFVRNGGALSQDRGRELAARGAQETCCGACQPPSI